VQRGRRVLAQERYNGAYLTPIYMTRSAPTRGAQVKKISLRLLYTSRAAKLLGVRKCLAPVTGRCGRIYSRSSFCFRGENRELHALGVLSTRLSCEYPRHHLPCSDTQFPPPIPPQPAPAGRWSSQPLSSQGQPIRREP
jgi:hypothetical protein